MIDLPPDFWSRPAPDTLAALDAKPEGLSAQEAARRLELYGANRLDERRRRHLLADLARRLANPLVAILLVASAVAGATGDLASFLIITAVVLLSTGLDIVQERRAEAAAEALRRSIALTVTVLRDGEPCDLAVETLVPGDIVKLSAGDLVPADGIVLEANAAQVNQAALTGEPYPVEKCPAPRQTSTMGEAPNALLHGSSVIGGTVTMLVVGTGAHTQFGKIAKALGEDQPPTAFERGIRRLGILIVRLTLFLVARIICSVLHNIAHREQMAQQRK